MGSIYLAVAVGVTSFLLGGRLFEARAKRRAGGALRGLAAIGARDVAVRRSDGQEYRIPVAQRTQWERQGCTTVVVAAAGVVEGVFALADTVKPTAAAAVTELHRLGLHTVLLTGDNQATARVVAAQVGIDEVIAEVLPHDKAAMIEDLQPRDARWPWSATGSTTRPRWPAPTWAWPSSPGPTSRWVPPTCS